MFSIHGCVSSLQPSFEGLLVPTSDASVSPQHMTQYDRAVHSFSWVSTSIRCAFLERAGTEMEALAPLSTICDRTKAKDYNYGSASYTTQFESLNVPMNSTPD